MPRANRYFISGVVWHITHRCHKKEFLLKLKRDRKAWIKHLFEAKKRYGLVVFNYMVTSNHIHLLVRSDDDDSISKSMQYVAGRTAQDYNRRKKRKGAFWEDRYHATAIESGEHLVRCMTYIDMNMVRAGVVHHPSEWDECGWKEILAPRERYGIIDHRKLIDALNVSDHDDLKDAYPHWLNEVLVADRGQRDERWSRAIAMGSEHFVEKMRRDLGLSLDQHKIIDGKSASHLMEPNAVYGESNVISFNEILDL